ncbi:MAG: hypothetical protein J6T52_13105 [Bacteroidaceae bacterium]|nr:hypothetical protein [Bacteroidaceae bacterium]
MKGKEKIGIWMICLIWVLAAGCSHSEDDAVVPVNKDVKTRLLTFTQMENRGSRAVLKEDAENGLSALWNSGDQLGCCNLSTLEEKIMNHEDISTGTLTAQYNNVRTSIFQGEMNCNQDHRLAVIYPVKNFGFGLESGEYFAKYTITLSGQDGTLEKLANSYHYMYGVATVNSVTGTTAEATGNMKSLLTVCKFSFTDGEGNPIRVKKLEISYGGDGLDGDFGTYPQTANVTCNINQEAVFADAVRSNDPLIIQTVLGSDSQYPTDVYVALLPVATRTFHFNVTDANCNTYTGLAQATLNAGDYVVASLPLKMMNESGI